ALRRKSRRSIAPPGGVSLAEKQLLPQRDPAAVGVRELSDLVRLPPPLTRLEGEVEHALSPANPQASRLSRLRFPEPGEQDVADLQAGRFRRGALLDARDHRRLVVVSGRNESQVGPQLVLLDQLQAREPKMGSIGQLDGAANVAGKEIGEVALADAAEDPEQVVRREAGAPFGEM